MKAAVIALCVGCTAPAIAVADAPAPTGLRVESFDVDFRYFYNPTRAARVENVAQSLASTADDVDLVCATMIVGEAERLKIIERTKERFPHVGFVRTDASTPLDDRRNHLGELVSPDLTPACTDPADIAIVDAYASCVRDKCVDTAGGVSFRCVSEACAGFGVPTAPRCAGCLNFATAFSSIDVLHKKCVEDARGELGNGGQLSMLILSRRPLTNVRAHMFPSSIYPYGAISARVDGGLNVMCNDLQQWGGPGPYIGVYAPNDPEGGGLEYQLAQLRAVDVARKLGREAPTVVLGGAVSMFLTKRGQLLRGDQDLFGVNLDAVVVPTLDLCTLCRSTNPLTKLHFGADGPDEFDQLLFTSGGPISATDVRIERTANAFTVDGAAVPASPKYGVSARISW
jgi:hypothetical protein